MKFPGRSSTKLAACMLLLILVPGCSSQKGLGDLFGKEKKQAAAATVCYSGSEGLEVRDAPKPGAKIVGHLKLHQKLLRSEVNGSYVRIKSSRSGIEGWVPATKLLRRLPGASAPPAANAATSEPAPAGDAAAEEAAPDEAAAPDDEAASQAEAAPEAAAPSSSDAAAEPAEPPAKPQAEAPAPARKPPSKSRNAASVFDPY